MSVETEIERLNASKSAIAQAIRDKGVDVPEDAKLDTFAAYVAMIGATSGIPVTSTGNPVVAIGTIANQPFEGLKIYGKSVQDGTPNPENLIPIISAGDEGEIDIVATGANILNPDWLSSSPNILFYCYDLKPGNYTISFVSTADWWSNNENDRSWYTRFYDEKGEEVYRSSITFADAAINIRSHESFTVPQGTAITYLYVYSNVTKASVTDLMLNIGLTMLPYEPYQSQTLTVSTPNSLPGIPVDSGGNYTDIERQQWGCDVKDYGTGKYTQMVGHIESYNGEHITTPYMSTTGQLSTGAEVYYVLDEPVVTDISADELAAYRALHTYDGTTVVSTAEDVAGLEVRYVADAQKYIDDRLAAAESHIQEIAAAQLNAQTGG